MTQANLSFWETDTWFNNIDVAIIGSGIVGLNAALNLKLKQPSLKVIILERGFLPSGASTKNAGFTCFGSPSELLDDLEHMDEDEVFALVEKRWRGLQRLRQNVGDAALDYQEHGGYEVFDNPDAYAACMDKLTYLNTQLHPIFKRTVYRTRHEKIKSFGFNNVTHLIVNVAEGQIHTGHMMDALTKRVQSLGVHILHSIHVTSFDQHPAHVSIHTDQHVHFNAGKLLIAVNGFARELLPDVPVYPARSQVLVTSPIPNLALQGTFHYDKGYYYFRNIQNRILLGGGRNLDFEGEQTSEFGLTSRIQEKLESLLQHMILPHQPYTIESRWSGIMGLGHQDKTFIVKAVKERIFCAIRMGGMGVALGSLVGEEAADLVLAH